MSKYLDKDGLIELWTRTKSTFIAKNNLQSAVEEKFSDIINNKSEDLKKVIESEFISIESIDSLFSDPKLETEDENMFLNLEGLIEYNDLIKQYINTLTDEDNSSWGTLGSSAEEE